MYGGDRHKRLFKNRDFHAGLLPKGIELDANLYLLLINSVKTLSMFTQKRRMVLQPCNFPA
jgi:hypothetical protein